MLLSAIPNIVQAAPVIPNTPAAYYALGGVAGAIICVIVWFGREVWLRRSDRPKDAAAAIESSPEDEPASDADAAEKKKPRKMSFRELLYIVGIYIGTDMIARGAKGIFPNFPVDALIWGALTGFVLCLMVLFGVRNLSRNKTSTGQQA